jgi:hypothetical protein
MWKCGLQMAFSPNVRLMLVFTPHRHQFYYCRVQGARISLRAKRNYMFLLDTYTRRWVRIADHTTSIILADL